MLEGGNFSNFILELSALRLCMNYVLCSMVASASGSRADRARGLGLGPGRAGQKWPRAGPRPLGFLPFWVSPLPD